MGDRLGTLGAVGFLSMFCFGCCCSGGASLRVKLQGDFNRAFKFWLRVWLSSARPGLLSRISAKIGEVGESCFIVAAKKELYLWGKTTKEAWIFKEGNQSERNFWSSICSSSPGCLPISRPFWGLLMQKLKNNWFHRFPVKNDATTKKTWFFIERNQSERVWSAICSSFPVCLASFRSFGCPLVQNLKNNRFCWFPVKMDISL